MVIASLVIASVDIAVILVRFLLVYRPLAVGAELAILLVAIAAPITGLVLAARGLKQGSRRGLAVMGISLHSLLLLAVPVLFLAMVGAGL